MANELWGRVEAAPEIRVELAGSGPSGPPGEPPRIGENGNWFIGGEDTGIPASGRGTEHAGLAGRDQADQHPIRAVTGLGEALERIPPAVEPITNREMEEMLK